MAQVRQMVFGALDVSTMPPNLVPQLSAESQLTPEELADLLAYRGWAQNVNPGHARDGGFYLFLEQRRKTRTWVVGSATAAAVLGVLAGWLAWGRR